MEHGGKFSYSRVSLYASCPQAHHYRYVYKLNKKGVVKPLTLGSDFHLMLEHRYDKKQFKTAFQCIKDNYNRLSEEDKEVLGRDYLSNLVCMFKDYQYLYKDTEKPTALEQKFAIDTGQFTFVGVIDEVYGNTLADHKTFTNAPLQHTLMLNQQMALYCKAHQIMTGDYPKYFMWDYIKSSPSKFPVWLEKSKRFSEAKSGVTPMSWKRALKERYGDDIPKDLLKKSSIFEDEIPKYFFRQTVKVDPGFVETCWIDYISLVNEMIQNPNNDRKNMTRDCSWCEYCPLCMRQSQSKDIKWLVDKEYVRRGTK